MVLEPWPPALAPMCLRRLGWKREKRIYARRNSPAVVVVTTVIELVLEVRRMNKILEEIAVSGKAAVSKALQEK